MDNDEIIMERLRALREEMAYLKDERNRIASFEAYRNDKRLRRAVERSLQVAIEACIDIGRRIIAQENLSYAEENREVFRVLADARIIPPELLTTLLDMAGFRNIIVHNYARVDDAAVYGVVTRKLDDFDDFAEVIISYLGAEMNPSGDPDNQPATNS